MYIYKCPLRPSSMGEKSCLTHSKYGLENTPLIRANKSKLCKR